MSGKREFVSKEIKHFEIECAQSCNLIRLKEKLQKLFNTGPAVEIWINYIFSNMTTLSRHLFSFVFCWLLSLLPTLSQTIIVIIFKSLEYVFFSFLFYTRARLVNNVVLISNVEQSDSVIHILVFILFQIFFPFRLI